MIKLVGTHIGSAHIFSRILLTVKNNRPWIHYNVVHEVLVMKIFVLAPIRPSLDR